MDERLRFVARLLEGEKMAPLCAEFGISRKTGYKLFDRYKDCGVQAFTDRSRRPVSASESAAAAGRGHDCAAEARVSGLGRTQDPREAAAAVDDAAPAGDQHRACGARSPRTRDGGAGATPTRGGPRLSQPTDPNALWCADYKGEFMLGNRRYCYPLTITDFASRYLLACDALSTTQATFAFAVFERAFKDFGLPLAIRTDNGVPVCRAHGPLRPQQARRVVAPARHSTRADCPRPSAAERPARAHASDAQDGGDQTRGRQRAPAAGALRCLRRRSTTDDRPHQALGMKVPGRRLRAIAARLSRPRGAHLPVPRHDDHRHALRPDLLQGAEGESQSRLCRTERRRHAGRRAHLARHLHAVRFGLFRRRDVPARTDRQSVRPESVTYVPGMNCHPCVRNGPSKSGRGDWIRTSDPLRPRRKNPHNWGQRETAAPRFS